MQQTRTGAATLHGHFERLDRQVAVVHGADGPTDDETGIQVQDDRQIRSAALPDAQHTGIANPALIRPMLIVRIKTLPQT